MTPGEFKAKWGRASGNERQTYQEHFRDLCLMLHQPLPSAADRADLTYTFERAVTTATGGQGFADVWKKGYFAWEYKGDKKNLDAAYAQVLSNAGAHVNFCNERPTWLRHLHERLDRAVWAAYGWGDDPAVTTDEEILERLLVLNGERANT